MVDVRVIHSNFFVMSRSCAKRNVTLSHEESAYHLSQFHFFCYNFAHILQLLLKLSLLLFIYALVTSSVKSLVNCLSNLI